MGGLVGGRGMSVLRAACGLLSRHASGTMRGTGNLMPELVACSTATACKPAATSQDANPTTRALAFGTL